MNKNKKIIFGIFKIISYIICLALIVVNLKENNLLTTDELVKPIIYIKNFFLRCIVVISIFTYAGFNLIKEILISNKVKYGIVEKYLSIIFFVIGVYSLFVPTEIIKVIEWFLLSILFYILYVISINTYYNNKYNRIN